MKRFLLFFMCFGLLAASPISKEDLARTAFRDYNLPLSQKEQDDIRFIVNTLGMSSLVKIAKAKSSLKKAGKRIDLVHPLQFLGFIFSEETMRVSIQAMQSRGWIWGDFFDGLKGSLEEEAARHNLLPEYIVDFSEKLGLNESTIASLIQKQQWNKLISTLIDSFPRTGDPNRYDM